MTATLPTDTTVDPVLAVDCPPDAGGCGSDPGARCLTPSGRATRPHTARIRAALAASPTAFTGPSAAPAGSIAVDGAGTAQAVPTAAPEPATAGPSTDEMVLRLLVLKVLAARVAEADGDTRDATVGLLDVGVSLPGYLTDEDRAAARRGERDRCLGKVGLSRPSESWKVEDVDAITAFVLEQAPDEVEHRPVVRASFLSALMASAKANGGKWMNPSTGELLEIPGVALRMGRPTLQVRPSEDAADLVAEALAAGLLTADGTLALPAGS